jgi:putative RNA 2'-phosphotransferase
MPASRPPDLLYHGTAGRVLNSIASNGILPGNRQFVHLSSDVETALKVGSRHGEPVVIKVLAGSMHSDGFLFYCSPAGVWLTRLVPPPYLSAALSKR